MIAVEAEGCQMLNLSSPRWPSASSWGTLTRRVHPDTLWKGTWASSSHRSVIKEGRTGSAESDITGPSATALVPVNHTVDDPARHYNKSEIVPGAKIKTVAYDGRCDPSRDVPGFEWVAFVFE